MDRWIEREGGRNLQWRWQWVLENGSLKRFPFWGDYVVLHYSFVRSIKSKHWFFQFVVFICQLHLCLWGVSSFIFSCHKNVWMIRERYYGVGIWTPFCFVFFSIQSFHFIPFSSFWALAMWTFQTNHFFFKKFPFILYIYIFHDKIILESFSLKFIKEWFRFNNLNYLNKILKYDLYYFLIYFFKWKLFELETCTNSYYFVLNFY